MPWGGEGGPRVSKGNQTLSSGYAYHLSRLSCWQTDFGGSGWGNFTGLASGISVLVRMNVPSSQPSWSSVAANKITGGEERCTPARSNTKYWLAWSSATATGPCVGVTRLNAGNEQVLLSAW